jgi:hypothetical protein
MAAAWNLYLTGDDRQLVVGARGENLCMEIGHKQSYKFWNKLYFHVNSNKQGHRANLCL